MKTSQQQNSSPRSKAEREAALAEIREHGPQGLESKKQQKAILENRRKRQEEAVMQGLPIPEETILTVPVETKPEATVKVKDQFGSTIGSKRAQIMKGLSTEWRDYKTIRIRAGFRQDPFLRDFLRSLVGDGKIEQMERQDGQVKAPLFFRLKQQS